MIAKHKTGRGKQIVLGALAFLAAGAASLWSWNTLASEYFGMAEMEFRHALAAEVLLVAAGALAGLRGRLGPVAE